MVYSYYIKCKLSKRGQMFWKNVFKVNLYICCVFCCIFLTVVFEILVSFSASGDWKKAFYDIIPDLERKLTKYSPTHSQE